MITVTLPNFKPHAYKFKVIYFQENFDVMWVNYDKMGIHVLNAVF